MSLREEQVIPVSRPSLTGNEVRYVNECLQSNWISSIGEFVDRFESQFAASCQSRHAIACCNGTVALHLALLALGVGPEDEVLVPSLTYVATANAVRYCGANPVFVDSDRETWNLDPADAARRVTRRTKAIIAVHLYGRPAPMDEINDLARAHDLKVVEDAAEAHGAAYKGRPVGSMSDVATFSFYGNKIITCGEGGMVLTDDERLASRVRQFKGQGQDPERRYWFPVIGYNYRMTNLQAAIGLGQLEQLASFLAVRDEIEAWYREELTGLPGVILPAPASHERTVCWLFSVVLADCGQEERDGVMEFMRGEAVDTRPFFAPLHTLPPYRGLPGLGSDSVAQSLGARGVSLPTWVGMTRDHVRRICQTLRRALKLAIR